MAKQSAKSEAELRGCVLGCISAIFAFGSLGALWLWSNRLASLLMERVIISMVYGSDRYAAGLRIVKHNLLSDGSRIPGFYLFIWNISSFICVVLVTFPYVRLLQRWGLMSDDEKLKTPSGSRDKRVL